MAAIVGLEPVAVGGANSRGRVFSRASGRDRSGRITGAVWLRLAMAGADWGAGEAEAEVGAVADSSGGGRDGGGGRLSVEV